jgi:hypothetical protein
MLFAPWSRFRSRSHQCKRRLFLRKRRNQLRRKKLQKIRKEKGQEIGKKEKEAAVSSDVGALGCCATSS